MKDFLKKLIATKTAQAENLRSLIKKAETADEVRSLGEQLDTVTAEIADAQAQLDAIPDDTQDDAQRSAVPADAQLRGGVPMATFVQPQPAPQARENVAMLDSMEYRNAFAHYVRTGEWKYEQRDGETPTDAIISVAGAGIGKVIPNTIMKELIKELKVYGQLYARVRKLNVKGGVEFPIEDLVPTVSWITETTVSTTQATPEVKTSVSFGYHIAEARIAQTLLSSIVSLEILESEIAKLLAEAFVKEFDRIIINGSGSGQPTGILNDSRVKAGNKITMSATDAVDWTKWREKLFAKVPLAYRAGGLLVMTVDTWESLICTMKDTNNRPLYTEVFDVATNQTVYRFNGKEVMLVESDLGLYDYSTATTGQPYMIYFKPECYAINSNLEIGFKRYFNEDTNKWVNKGLCIMDGKLLDVNSAYIIKK